MISTKELAKNKNTLKSLNENASKYKRARDASPIEQEIILSEQFQKTRKIADESYQNNIGMDNKIFLDTIKSIPTQIFDITEYTNRDKILSPKDKQSPREKLDDHKLMMPQHIQKFIHNLGPDPQNKKNDNIEKIISRLKLPNSKNFTKNLVQMKKLGLHQEKHIEDQITDKMLMKSSTSPNSPLNNYHSPFLTYSPAEYSLDGLNSLPYDSEELVITFDDTPINDHIHQNMDDLSSPKMTLGITIYFNRLILFE